MIIGTVDVACSAGDGAPLEGDIPAHSLSLRAMTARRHNATENALRELSFLPFRAGHPLFQKHLPPSL